MPLGGYRGAGGTPSRIWPDAPLRPICTNFGERVCLMDLISGAKFYRNRLRGLDFVGVEFGPFPYECDVAVNIVCELRFTL